MKRRGTADRTINKFKQGTKIVNMILYSQNVVFQLCRLSAGWRIIASRFERPGTQPSSLAQLVRASDC